MGYSHLMGHSFQHFLVRYAHIFALADYVFAILFALSFLRVRHYMPRMIPVFHVVIALCGIGIVSSILGFRSVAVGFVQLLGVVFPISLLYISIIIYRKGFWPARFYIPAWTLVLGSVGYTILCFQGVFPVTDSTFMAIPYGSTVELFFLCFALADRIRQLKEEKQSAIEKNLELVSKLNVVLENKVALRTTELNETLSDLRDSNAIKDRLFSMVTHDVRSPVGNLYNMICMLESNVMTQKDFNDMLPLIKEDTAQLMNNLTKLLRWASGQITHTVFRPELVNLSRFFEEHVDMYKYLAYVKRIEIKIVCDEGMVVYVDPNYLSVVYRNLIDNAIKFTPPGGEVEMGCRGMNGMYMLYLKNSGTPLSQEKIDTILSTNEGPTVAADGSSTGLGLQLCKEFLIRLGSSLMIKNEPDTGVLFYFMLPVTTATTIEKGNRLLPQLPFEEDINNNN
jgi:signal transduction histidine kinase